MIPWHYSNPPISVDPHRASSSRPKNAVKTRKGLLRPENRSRQPRISFWEPAHLVSRLRVATGVPRPCFFRAGEGRSPPLAAMENVRKGPQVLYFEASPGGPTPHFSPGEGSRRKRNADRAALSPLRQPDKPALGSARRPQRPDERYRCPGTPTSCPESRFSVPVFHSLAFGGSCHFRAQVAGGSSSTFLSHRTEAPQKCYWIHWVALFR